jgi:outer membrane protein OmpA-like peptidoglycan-associated protein
VAKGTGVPAVPSVSRIVLFRLCFIHLRWVLLMSIRIDRSFLAAFIGAAWLVASVTHAQADCDNLLKSFNAAIAGQSLSEAQALEGKIATDGACGAYKDEVQRQRAILELRMAQVLSNRSAQESEYESLIIDAEKPEILWRASVGLADLRFSQRRFAEASSAYERALEIMKSRSKTPTEPDQATIKAVFDRASESRMLASSEETSGGKPVFVAAAKDHRDGTVGGSMSENIRGFAVSAVPVPVQFETASAKFTPVGEQAAKELLDAIRDQRPPQITIVGHTDERGEADYNIRLSDQRAKAVADYLKQNGVVAKIVTIAKGKSEPLQLSNTEGLSRDDIWALNRRVVWKRQ